MDLFASVVALLCDSTHLAFKEAMTLRLVSRGIKFIIDTSQLKKPINDAYRNLKFCLEIAVNEVTQGQKFKNKSVAQTIHRITDVLVSLNRGISANAERLCASNGTLKFNGRSFEHVITIKQLSKHILDMTMVENIVANSLAKTVAKFDHYANEFSVSTAGSACECIKNPQIKAMWAKLFGENTFYVPWDTFYFELSNKALNKHGVLAMKYGSKTFYAVKEFLTFPGSAVSVTNMEMFSSLFPTSTNINVLLHNFHVIANKSGFAGGLSKEECRVILDQFANTKVYPEKIKYIYLIRYSSTFSMCFALDIKSLQDGSVVHMRNIDELGTHYSIFEMLARLESGDCHAMIRLN
jgi:hypothetical protein